MTTNEANKIIAEYMGKKNIVLLSNGFMEIYEPPNITTVRSYASSLDALVPVWEKLNVSTVKHNFLEIEKHYTCRIVANGQTSHSLGTDSINKAAAIATAKAIKGYYI